MFDCIQCTRQPRTQLYLRFVRPADRSLALSSLTSQCCSTFFLIPPFILSCHHLEFVWRQRQTMPARSLNRRLLHTMQKKKAKTKEDKKHKTSPSLVFLCWFFLSERRDKTCSCSSRSMVAVQCMPLFSVPQLHSAPCFLHFYFRLCQSSIVVS